jgi:hypothetical protein
MSLTACHFHGVVAPYPVVVRILHFSVGHSKGNAIAPIRHILILRGEGFTHLAQRMSQHTLAPGAGLDEFGIGWHLLKVHSASPPINASIFSPNHKIRKEFLYSFSSSSGASSIGTSSCGTAAGCGAGFGGNG